MTDSYQLAALRASVFDLLDRLLPGELLDVPRRAARSPRGAAGMSAGRRA